MPPELSSTNQSRKRQTAAVRRAVSVRRVTTRELNISNAAIVDLNGSTQTVETFTGQMGSTVLFKEGALTVNKGGISQGELTGGGNLNVTGGTLAIEGLNARYNALIQCVEAAPSVKPRIRY